jgi:DNA-binding transcriptional LysR family regulator
MPDISDTKLRKLDLGLLLVFQEIYRHGNLSAAADRLRLSQPAVSQALKRLEELLEEPLFIRSPAGTRPTSRAIEMAPKVDALLALASETVMSRLRFDPAASNRLFRVHAADFAASLLTAPLVRRFAIHAPAAKLSLGFAGVPSQAFHLLRNGGLDLAVGRFPGLPKDCIASRLFEEDYQVVARVGHPLTGGGLDLDTYLRCQHIIVSFAGDLIGTIDGDLASLGHTRHVVVASPMFLSAFAAVSTSDLIATSPRRLAARFAGVFGLAAYELPFPASPFHIDLIRARSSLKDRALDWLAEEIQMVLGDKHDREATSTGLPAPAQVDTVRGALLEHAVQSGVLRRDASSVWDRYTRSCDWDREESGQSQIS